MYIYLSNEYGVFAGGCIKFTTYINRYILIQQDIYIYWYFIYTYHEFVLDYHRLLLRFFDCMAWCSHGVYSLASMAAISSLMPPHFGNCPLHEEHPLSRCRRAGSRGICSYILYILRLIAWHIYTQKNLLSFYAMQVCWLHGVVSAIGSVATYV